MGSSGIRLDLRHSGRVWEVGSRTITSLLYDGYEIQNAQVPAREEGHDGLGPVSTDLHASVFELSCVSDREQNVLEWWHHLGELSSPAVSLMS